MVALSTELLRESRHVQEFMTPAPAVLRDDQSVDQTVAHLRAHAWEQTWVYFYVIDAAKKLVGVVSSRQLLLSPGHKPLREVMTDAVVSLRARDTLVDACEVFAIHRLLVIPVVNDQGELAGILDISVYTDEVFEWAQKGNRDEVFQILGMHLELLRRGGPWSSFRARMPWLLCNLAGGLTCAALGSFFEATLEQLLVITLFIPVILTLSESVSIQSMTLALEAPSHGTAKFERLWHELLAGGLLGLCAGCLVALAVQLWTHRPGVAMYLGSVIALTMLQAVLLGNLMPGLVRRMHLNPRVASGPVVLALVDVLTIALLFGGAAWLLV